MLETAGFDGLPQRIGVGEALSGLTRPSQLAHGAAIFFAMLFAGDIALGSLILVVGFWLSNLAYRAIDKASSVNSTGLASIARIAILGVVIAMGLRAGDVTDRSND